MNFIKRIFCGLTCDIHNNIVEPLSRRHNSRKKTHYECCVCGMIEAPYFYEDTKYTSMRWDYGWHKLDGGKRWICHHCADHGYAPLSAVESTFEEWYKTIAEPHRQKVKSLIKEKDPKYYEQCYFYDDDYPMDNEDNEES